MLRTQQAREAMIASQLLPNEVTDERVLAAMTKVDRSLFVPDLFKGVAYADSEILVANHRWMIKPMLFAKLLQLAAFHARDKVLYIGAGLGYGPAVVAALARQIIAVESVHELADIARHTLRDDNQDIDVFSAPLTMGYPLAAPYDVIFIEGAAQYIPSALIEQLQEGGRIVGVLNIQQRVDSLFGLGKAFIAYKTRDGVSIKQDFDASAPLLPGFEKKQEFTF